MSKAPSPRKSKSQKPKYRDRGPHGLSVPEAGAMIGLGRNASYEAAKEGRIPVMKIGALKIVPRGPWLKQIGADDAAKPQDAA
jgi:hypothetical protein